MFVHSDTPTAPELTQAQVILNGLNSLFDVCEQRTLEMLDGVEEILIPDDWKSVDLVKQTKDVMVLVQQLDCTSTCTACICFLHYLYLVLITCMCLTPRGRSKPKKLGEHKKNLGYPPEK